MAQMDRKRLGRAALVGLAGGLIAGSMFLTYQGVIASRVDCDGAHLDTEECAFLEETAHLAALQQLAAAMGLALCGAGAALWARKQVPPAQP